MLDRLTKDELIALAAEADVKVDKRWNRERIVSTLEGAGVEAPERVTGDKLSEQLVNEPVKFMGTIGRIVVRDPKMKNTQFGPVEDPGLRVDFGDGYAEEASLTGGLSREFYPDLDDHDDESAYCSCAACLAELRDWIQLDKHGLVARYHIQQADLIGAVCPLPSATAWENLQAADVKDAHKIAGFDLTNAVRYEQRTSNREAVIAALDELASVPDVATDADILDAELSIG